MTLLTWGGRRHITSCRAQSAQRWSTENFAILSKWALYSKFEPFSRDPNPDNHATSAHMPYRVGRSYCEGPKDSCIIQKQNTGASTRRDISVQLAKPAFRRPRLIQRHISKIFANAIVKKFSVRPSKTSRPPSAMPNDHTLAAEHVSNCDGKLPLVAHGKKRGTQRSTGNSVAARKKHRYCTHWPTPLHTRPGTGTPSHCTHTHTFPPCAPASLARPFASCADYPILMKP